MRRRIISTLLVIIVACGLIGCGNSSSDIDKDIETSDETAEASEIAAADDTQSEDSEKEPPNTGTDTNESDSDMEESNNTDSNDAEYKLDPSIERVLRKTMVGFELDILYMTESEIEAKYGMPDVEETGKNSITRYWNAKRVVAKNYDDTVQDDKTKPYLFTSGKLEASGLPENILYEPDDLDYYTRLDTYEPSDFEGIKGWFLYHEGNGIDTVSGYILKQPFDRDGITYEKMADMIGSSGTVVRLEVKRNYDYKPVDTSASVWVQWVFPGEASLLLGKYDADTGELVDLQESIDADYSMTHGVVVHEGVEWDVEQN